MLFSHYLTSTVASYCADLIDLRSLSPPPRSEKNASLTAPSSAFERVLLAVTLSQTLVLLLNRGARSVSQLKLVEVPSSPPPPPCNHRRALAPSNPSRRDPSFPSFSRVHTRASQSRRTRGEKGGLFLVVLFKLWVRVGLASAGSPSNCL